MKGKVIKCVKNNYTVSITNGQLFKCKLKSSERLKERNFTNPRNGFRQPIREHSVDESCM